MKNFFLYLFLWLNHCFGQSYTSYFTGNPNDMLVNGKGGTCLMGGAGEQDNAMRWFLQQANGGDVLVLRASGSDGYNAYLYSELGVSVNSVETIVFNNSSASTDTYVLDKIQKAEAIWLAGGDQWNYISYWRNTPVSTLINQGIVNRKIVVGGISAGMAILGGTYFSAENGTVTSATALANPFSTNVTVSNLPFLNAPYLTNVITDTHYDNPDRKGRQLVFMARANELGNQVHGIACDEYVAVCIDTFGVATVYGEYPAYDEKAYFLSVNCEVENNFPEELSANVPLSWNQSGKAIKVYKAFGTIDGSATFNLNSWNEGTGGTWENWSVNNGILTEETEQNAPNCGLYLAESVKVFFKNPIRNEEWLPLPSNCKNLKITNSLGLNVSVNYNGNDFQIQKAVPGIYYITYELDSIEYRAKVIVG